MPQVDVRIDKKGNVTIDVIGMEGADCERITQAFREALGGDLIEDTQKPEYYVELTEQYVSLDE